MITNSHRCYSKAPSFFFHSNSFVGSSLASPTEPRHALFVSNHWCDDIVSDQELCSTIILHRNFADRFNFHSRSALISRAGTYICACLDRSASLPLDVTLSAPSEDIGGVLCGSVLDPLLLFNPEEPRHIQRCRSLSWYVNISDVSEVSALRPASLQRLGCLL